jgi:hypothetical protein
VCKGNIEMFKSNDLTHSVKQFERNSYPRISVYEKLTNEFDITCILSVLDRIIQYSK